MRHVVSVMARHYYICHGEGKPPAMRFSCPPEKVSVLTDICRPHVPHVADKVVHSAFQGILHWIAMMTSQGTILADGRTILRLYSFEKDGDGTGSKEQKKRVMTGLCVEFLG